METISTIGVCGAGTMGSGIAQLCAQKGIHTVLFDVNETVLQNSRSNIWKNLETLQQKGKISKDACMAIKNQLHFTHELTDCKAPVIIEAIIEQKESKANLFNQLISINNHQTIFASNTSSISINALAASITQPQRLAGLHFFNPATIMQLVEVIKGEQTAPEVITKLVALSQQLGKTPVLCNDAPGFIVNRVARPYYLEALRLVEQGLATVEQVDAIMEASGFKMGPFKLMDLIGIDINYSVSCIVWEALGKPTRLMPSTLQQQKVEVKQLGKKSGIGFYFYQ
ncbi:MAG: 3-hydroxybutyryl-CoA dehydrogenase [Sphingobacteriales bacterium]|uniref:3-hydroxyacyl-CoA dehydrogenase family protein n=1 Tax=Hydrotalea flava TaxID=714549 RepID=UPI000832DFBF|nr:3-hydroxyacyl-CoA dehydrogenase NAD-binding domain-containing protein [Hydrotalea flava]RTL50027.1 MAG: 3-hydroxybutyryl-CoA dehydrogenase [Sphingobacteriales bacterium]